MAGSGRPKKPEQIPFRASPALMKLLRECAKRHGRSVAEELRVAVELHVTRSIVEALPDPDVRRNVGKDAARVEEEMRARLARLCETAYGPNARQGLLDSLIWVNDRVTR